MLFYWTKNKNITVGELQELVVVALYWLQLDYVKFKELDQLSCTL